MAPTIIVEYKNRMPVDLLDLTGSLTSIGEQFREFATDFADTANQSRLYVHQMRPGSIIAELVPWMKQVDFIAKHRDEIAGFVAQWQEILTGILNLSDKAREVPKPVLRAAKTFVEPVAKDGGAQINMIATDGGTIINNFSISSDDGSAIIRNANHLLRNDIPSETRFFNEPMALFQMRDAPAGKMGDMGFIDRFSPKPKKLTFASDDAKRSILGRHENPFELYFFVTGIAKTAGGDVAAYHIHSCDSVAPKDG